MPEFYPLAGGNSSIEVNRTAKGDYTWSLKLYFLGHDMRMIKQMISNIIKAREILETQLGQKIIPTEEMSTYNKKLVEDAAKSAADFLKKKAKPAAEKGKEPK